MLGPLPDWANSMLRVYEVVKLTGWSLEQIESTPALVLDRLLLIHHAHQRAQASLTEG
jgi:hypothetical protein